MMHDGKLTVVGKLVAVGLPGLTILYIIASFLFNLGQVVQSNTDHLNQVEKRMCRIERALRVPDECTPY